MTFTMIAFVGITVALVGLLAWATKPPRLAVRPTTRYF